MPEEHDKDKDKKITGDDIDSIIGNLNLEALSRQYEVEITAPTEPLPENTQPEGEGVALADEPLPDSKSKTRLLDMLGTLLLLFSLVIYGIPMIIGKAKRQFSAALCLILSLVIILCSFHVAGSYRHVKIATEQNNPATQETVEIAVPTKSLLPNSVNALQPVSQIVTYPPEMLEKYKAAYAINPDVAGSIRITNTSIDTLLLQDKSNTHYLRYDFYNRYTEFGNAFIDYRNKLDALSQNTIIYGHTTQGKLQVFNDLYKYMDYDFYTNNPIIEFGTLYKDYRWKIFAVYITSVEGKDDNGYFFYYIHPEINESNFTGYLGQIMQRSRFFTDIGVTAEDRILTLSTCVYDNNFAGNTVDSRLVVAARLMRDGESSETDPSKVLDTPNFRRPQVWYSHFGQKNPYAKSENWEQ